MFFKKIKNITLTFILTLFILPINIQAYSNYIIASGESVGIKLNIDGVLIVGSYKINGHDTLNESNLKIGDVIKKINNIECSTVDEFIETIKNCNCDVVNITYERDKQIYNTQLNVYNENGVLKIGLYIKDSISGVGTLTYIDPSTNIFGVLGHEIMDSNTKKIININSGSIFNSKITGITRSINGNPGEKNANLFSNQILGSVNENTNKGIFGKYTSNINNQTLYKVAKLEDIKLGNAKMLTVINDNLIEEFDINITSVNKTKDKLKNIEFEIVDEKLLSETNGIVQGMSGSPIIQGDYIIGAVTHVVVENPHKGYGILITNMLEESEN